MPFVTGDDIPAGALIGLHQIAKFLGVELLRQGGGTHQVAEQHGELAALGFRAQRWFSGRDCLDGGGRGR
jgi:hypothetical protein